MLGRLALLPRFLGNRWLGIRRRGDADRAAGQLRLIDPDTRMTTIVLTKRPMRGPDDLALHIAVRALAYHGLTD
jgi:hypothetical protein